MKRFILVFIFLLTCFFSSVLIAQSTAPVPTTFTILDRGDDPSYRDLLKNPTNPVLRGDEVQLQAYSVEYGDAVDSVYYTRATQVKMANSEGEIKYDIEVKSIGYGVNPNGGTGVVDSIATVEIRKRSYRLDSTATTVVWLNSANRNVVDSLGWTFTDDVSVGDKFRVVLTYDYLMSADRDGRLETAARLTDGDSVLVTDPVMRALVFLTNAHYHKHAGESYTSGADSSLGGADDSLEVFLLTPNSDTRIHIIWDVRATAECYFYIKEAITVSVAVDTITAVNDDYGSTNESSVILIKAPRSAATGTLMQPMKIIGSTNRAGGNVREIGERVLDTNKNYVFGVHSTSAAVVSVELQWYEHISME